MKLREHNVLRVREVGEMLITLHSYHAYLLHLLLIYMRKLWERPHQYTIECTCLRYGATIRGKELYND